MSYSEILNIVLPIFIAIIIGYLFGRFVKIDLTGLNQIIFYIGLPALSFSSILDQEIVLSATAEVWASALIISLGCLGIAWFIFKLMKEKHSGLYLPVFLPNTVYIPFPIINLAYGAAGIFVAVLYYIPSLVITYTLGIFVAAGKSKRENFKEVLKVPTLYAAFLGLAFNLLHVDVPPLVIRPLSFIGGMVTPAMVLTLGYSLSRIKLSSLPTTFLTSLIRMGGGLALGFLTVYLFDLTGIYRSIVIFMSAMPAAVVTYMLAAMYKNEEEMVASVVLVTTVASLFVIPVLLRIL